MKLMKYKKYLKQKFSRKVLVPNKYNIDLVLKASKSYDPFIFQFNMAMNYALVLHKNTEAYSCHIKEKYYVVLTTYMSL